MHVFSKALLLGSILTGLTAKAVSTEDYYRCESRVSGEWKFGRAPSACATSEFASDGIIQKDFRKIIFDDSLTRTSERQRYMNELYALIKEASTYYLKKRKPSASPEEINNWNWGVFATAANESYWSHYRRPTDAVLRMMRGDVGHGHGLMQIDDRAHFNTIEQGIAAHFAGNFVYGLDILYTGWQRAPAQSCVGSETNWEARIRSAWAAYNGGPGSICRWTNSSSAWAQNDKNFYYHLKNKTWNNEVSVTTQKTSFDVACLVEQRENCPQTQISDMSHPVVNTLYKMPGTQGYCASPDLKAWHCVTEVRDRECLRAYIPVINSDMSAWLSSFGSAPAQRRTYDRHVLCSQAVEGLMPVGSYFEAKKDIKVRVTPGAGQVATLTIGESYQILDFEVRFDTELERYYKITETKSGKTGWIYGGVDSTWETWAVPSSGSSLPGNIARQGDSVKIVISSGINIRKTPGGTRIGALASGDNFVVLETKFTGDTNEVYYKVNSQYGVGYIYSGQLKPINTIQKWTLRLSK